MSMLVHGMWHFFTSARVSKLWWSRLKNRPKSDHGEQTDMDKKATLKILNFSLFWLCMLKCSILVSYSRFFFGVNYIVFYCFVRSSATFTNQKLQIICLGWILIIPWGSAIGPSNARVWTCIRGRVLKFTPVWRGFWILSALRGQHT